MGIGFVRLLQLVDVAQDSLSRNMLKGFRKVTKPIESFL